MKVQKVFELVITARANANPQIVLQKSNKPCYATSLGMNVDDNGTAVLYETGLNDTLEALELLTILCENYTKERERAEMEMVIESDEQKVYTADFEIKYENEKIVFYELSNAKAW